MELKRILAKDTKSANDKAIALFGPDVLVISSARVRGQVELIVAVDIPAIDPNEALAEQIELTPKQYQRRVDATFSEVLADEIKNAKPIKTKPANKPLADNPVQAQVQAQVQAHAQAQAQAQEALRGQEIVALVREELASLRREFKLSQQMALQASQPLHESLEPLAQALQDVNMPVALRTLVMDGLHEAHSLEAGLAMMSHMLKSAIDRERSPLPLEGLHALGGLSGSGKSSMIARWAQQAVAAHGCDAVVVISHMDHRAGAWNQTQLLCSQSGVACYRTTNVGMLKLLLEEHAHRRLILIDTPGVGMKERLDELQAAAPSLQLHAVLTADASQATLSKVLRSGLNWQSLFVTKLDESEQPWPLIQALSENPLPLHAVSHGEALTAWQHPFAVTQLVNQAIDHLPLPASGSSASTLIPHTAPAVAASLRA